MLQFFEDQHPRAFAQHKAVAVLVERPGGLGGTGVVRREGGEQIEAGHAERVNHAVRSAGEHHVRIAPADDFGRFADGLARSRARGQAVEVRPLGVEQARQMTGGAVGFLFQFLLRMKHRRARIR